LFDDACRNPACDPVKVCPMSIPTVTAFYESRAGSVQYVVTYAEPRTERLDTFEIRERNNWRCLIGDP
jgi:hypothetical protein